MNFSEKKESLKWIKWWLKTHISARPFNSNCDYKNQDIDLKFNLLTMTKFLSSPKPRVKKKKKTESPLIIYRREGGRAENLPEYSFDSP